MMETIELLAENKLEKEEIKRFTDLLDKAVLNGLPTNEQSEFNELLLKQYSAISSLIKFMAEDNEELRTQISDLDQSYKEAKKSSKLLGNVIQFKKK